MLKIRVLVVSAFLSSLTFAMHPVEPGGAGITPNNGNADSGHLQNQMQLKSANCSPSKGRITLEMNNVRTFIETSGYLWNDRISGTAGYQIPKVTSPNEQLRSVIFAGGLWMGGTDVNGQLKLAAVRFRQGNDYWPGPLSAIPGTGNFVFGEPGDGTLRRDYGTAEIASEECLKYDNMFTIRRGEVQQFIVWWQCQNGLLEADQCAEVTLDNEVLQRIIDWPAHGLPAEGQDFYLAPFYDNPLSPNGLNGIYDPVNDGDYPWYDFAGDVDCRNDRRITLFGDETHWWVFNDKGNIHTETGADPIGMEIRAQAFAFATDDQINNMTFYNYELINRSTQTLQDTYFGQYADPDVGCSADDYAGCDVGRGLGFVYNATPVDGDCNGAFGYGENPPAVGIDFFEGPYQDDDGMDNAVGIGLNEALNGLGYGDGVIDNERYGMRRFVYYSNPGFGSPNPNTTDPTNPTHHYNYMRGFWKDGSRMLYGGTGYAGGAPTTIEADFMFPGSSDTLNWGTHGTDPGFSWSEEGEGNQEGDRRFIQAAGPFVLQPGAVNNITVGVVYGRSSGGNLESVDAMKAADTKAQALFDNCFAITEPPPAPVLTARELENEIILFISNPPSSPNANEDYYVRDRINIITPDSLAAMGEFYNDTFRFEGYQIYQLKSGEVSVADIGDNSLARLVAQCDIKNGIKRLVNYEYNEELDLSFPSVMVEGEDEGIRHSFRVTTDLFSTSDNPDLVNHKRYYYIAVSYAYNEYKKYNPEDPLALDGQRRPYMRSRNMADGSSIVPITVVPSSPLPSNNGQMANSDYGDTPQLTRIDGAGNGGNYLKFTTETEALILQNGKVNEVVYEKGYGPVKINVIDPLNVAPGDFTFKFIDQGGDIDTASWMLINLTLGDTVFSSRNISIFNEQLILDWGLSVEIEQPVYESGHEDDPLTEFIDVSLNFTDSSKFWLTGLGHFDGFGPLNWLASGLYEPEAAECNPGDCNNNPCSYASNSRDASFEYSGFLSGAVAPFYIARVASAGSCPAGPPIGGNSVLPANTIRNTCQKEATLDNMPSIDIVVTSDQSKWTRCPVIEMGNNVGFNEGGKNRYFLRSGNSVGKNGSPDGTGTGMGWFPGYAIDLETGTRLNMAFGENSGAGAGDNGRDMIWNPTSSVFNTAGAPIFGGMHYVYVFRETANMPSYDEGQTLYNYFAGMNVVDYIRLWSSCAYIMRPLLAAGEELLATDARLTIRNKLKYRNYNATGVNNGRPQYNFSTYDLAPTTMNAELADSAMLRINVVPNPYYAYSAYETDRLDNRIKITNLPEVCTVKIFNSAGSLIRVLTKDDSSRSMDWDMKNEVGIPIAGGLYILHVEDSEGREAVVKWFGALRPADLQNF